MNHSVWNSQIASSLLQFIQSTVVVTGQTVHSFVRKPEEDFDNATLPCVTIYHQASHPHQSRFDYVGGKKVVSGETITYIENPTMFTHVYQIDFWSRYQSQMDEMTFSWLSSVDKDFVLTTKNMANVDTSFSVLEDSPLRKADLVSGRERLFHSFLTYRIFTDVDTQKIMPTPQITTMTVEVQNLEEENN